MLTHALENTSGIQVFSVAPTQTPHTHTHTHTRKHTHTHAHTHAHTHTHKYINTQTSQSGALGKAMKTHTHTHTHTHIDTHRQGQLAHRICTEFDRCVLQCSHRVAFLQVCRLLIAKGRLMLQRQRSRKNSHFETTRACEAQTLAVTLSCHTTAKSSRPANTKRHNTGNEGN